MFCTLCRHLRRSADTVWVLAHRRWKTRRRGRPRIDAEIRELIRRMCLANPLWGAPRMHGELLTLGKEISEATVSKCMIRYHGAPSPTWRTCLQNHSRKLISLNLFAVPTAIFNVLFAPYRGLLPYYPSFHGRLGRRNLPHFCHSENVIQRYRT